MAQANDFLFFSLLIKFSCGPDDRESPPGGAALQGGVTRENIKFM